MRLGALASATATTTSLMLGAMVSLAPGEEASAGEEPAAKLEARKFDHAAHAELDPPVPVAECARCHGSDPRGKLQTPGARGHQPCLASGCHAEDFMSVGARTRRDAPERYRKAAAFCAGCHRSPEGRAPSPFRKASADNAYQSNPKPGHHVEMNHLAHVERTDCRTCHVVDPESFALVLDSPGHRECASCHEDNEELTMDECAGCHRKGSPKSYFEPRKFSSDVRTCDSDRYRKLSQRRKGREVPCFQHEHEGHRVTGAGEKVQCGDCHFMFESKRYAGYSYKSLRDIKRAPLMDNRKDRAHAKCGASGCHRQAVDDGQGLGRCGMCHSTRSILNGLVDPSPGAGRPRAERAGEDRGKGQSRKSARSALDALLEDGHRDEKRQKKRKKRRKKGSLRDLVD